jgi:hypothetical protein
MLTHKFTRWWRAFERGSPQPCNPNQARGDLAAKAEIERLLNHNPHLMKDIGLIDANPSHLDRRFSSVEVLVVVTQGKRHWEMATS